MNGGFGLFSLSSFKKENIMEREQINFLALSNIGFGAAQEMFNEALEKVIENINDPNTSDKKPREINLKVSILPEENRNKALIKVGVTFKLAHQKPFNSTIVLGKDQGRHVAVEYGNVDQLDFFREPKPFSIVKA